MNPPFKNQAYAPPLKQVVAELAMQHDQLQPVEIPDSFLTSDVVIQSVTADTVFFVTAEQHREMRKIPLEIPRRITYLKKSPSVGSLWMVYSRYNPFECFRVSVLSATKEQAEVFLIDVGEVRLMAWKKLSPIPDHWAQMPNRLLKARIDGYLMCPRTLHWFKLNARGSRYWNYSYPPILPLIDIVSRMLKN